MKKHAPFNKDLKRGKNELLFTLRDSHERPITEPQIVLIISMPSTTRYNREVPLVYVAEGKYRADVIFPLHGCWDLKLKLLRNWKPVFLEKRVYVGE